MVGSVSERLFRLVAIYRLCSLLGPFVVSLLLVFIIASVQRAQGAQDDPRCFPETGHCISGRMRAYWEQNGGIAVFGLPITPQREEVIEGRALQVQWFERNRLELHPENDPPYDVLLGRLAVDVLAQQGRDWHSFPHDTIPADEQQDCRFFEATSQYVCGDILEVWRSNGLELDGVPGFSEVESLALFGLPLSGVRPERLNNGEMYLVQWFERVRFELHPQNEPPYHVLLGRLGSELYATNGTGGGQVSTPTPTLPPSPTLEPAATPTPSPTPEPLPDPIAFQSDRDGNLEVYLVNSDGSGLINLTNQPGDDSDPAWAPDGERLAFVSNRAGETYDLYTMKANGRDQARLVALPGDDFAPAWSPDGKRLAFTSGPNDIYTIQADGSNLLNLTNTQGANWAPDWSRFSMRLAFQSDRDGNWDIYTMNSDGSGLVNLTNHSAQDSGPVWAPDGRRLAFVSNRDGNAEIYLMDDDGSGLVNLTNYPLANDFSPTWSPDGTRLAFVSDRHDNAEIYVMNLDGTGVTRLTYHVGDDSAPAWAP